MDNKFFMYHYNTKLGFDQRPISEIGCTLCVAAYYVSYLTGNFVSPVHLNQILKENNGYVGNNLINWLQIAHLFNLQPYAEINKYEHPSKLFQSPIVVSVDGSIYGYPKHFLFVKDYIYNKNDFSVFDPADPDSTKLMSRFGKDSLKNSIYSQIKYLPK